MRHPSPWIPGSDSLEIIPNQKSFHRPPLTKVQAKALSFPRPISSSLPSPLLRAESGVLTWHEGSALGRIQNGNQILRLKLWHQTTGV